MKNKLKKHSDRAVELYLSGFNCAQSIFASFSDLTGISEEEALRTASALGGGVSGMREVCGAVTGTALVLGALNGYSDASDYDGKKKLYADVQAIAEKFREKHKSIVCRELLEGIKYGSVPMVRNAEYYEKRPCAGYIETAACLLDEFLSEDYEADEK